MRFSYCVDSEYKPLRSVLLHKPAPEVGDIADPKEALHIRKIDYAIMEEEYRQIVNVYRKFKIKVHLITNCRKNNNNGIFLQNLMFVRDLFFMTPRGAIISRMSSGVRKEEAGYAEKAIRGIGINIRKVIEGRGTFEGADALWVNNRLILIGVGKRTNAEGFRQVKEELKLDGVLCIRVPAPEDTLHLLGALQLVDSNLALVRADTVSSEATALLRKNKIKVISIRENAELKKKHAMNFLTIAPGKIIMPADCPRTKRIYEKSGIKIAAEVSITQLANAAGGLACATGILARA